MNFLKKIAARLGSEPPAAPTAPHLKLGRGGEDAAASHLEGLGYKLLKRDFRCPLGEIDLIARDADTVVFVEVKTRSSYDYGTPEEGITERQKRRIVRAALVYLKRLKGHPPARFDVVAVDENGLRHHKNAFSAEGYTY